jgi:hypothetical protein
MTGRRKNGPASTEVGPGVARRDGAGVGNLAARRYGKSTSVTSPATISAALPATGSKLSPSQENATS